MARTKSLIKRKKRDPLIQQIETLRLDTGLTQKALAEMMGITSMTLYRRHKDVGGFTVSELKRAADIFKVKLKITFEEYS